MDAARPGGDPSPFLQPDAAARRLARRLVREARHGALAAAEPETGFPLASRVAVGTNGLGDPVLLVSRLSAHTGALLLDGRCSLLLGEPGAGDPLRHPRIAVRGRAEALGTDDATLPAVRRRFLARHPGAALYVDFADFLFVRVRTEGALLNGGFARAFHMAREDLCEPPADGVEEAEARVVEHMNGDHGDAVDAILAAAGESGEGWRIVGADRSGFEAMRAERVRRVEFAEPLGSGAGYRDAFVRLASEAHEAAG